MLLGVAFFLILLNCSFYHARVFYDIFRGMHTCAVALQSFATFINRKHFLLRQFEKLIVFAKYTDFLVQSSSSHRNGQNCQHICSYECNSSMVFSKLIKTSGHLCVAQKWREFLLQPVLGGSPQHFGMVSQRRKITHDNYNELYRKMRGNRSFLCTM